MDVYIADKRHRLDPAHSVGKGGEADVYRLDDRTVVKVFKQPDHPDYSGNPAEAEGARRRIEEHQTKLREFPRIIGTKVVRPIDLATDRAGDRVLGYTMQFIPKADVLLRWGERAFRGTDLDNNKVADIFLKLHETVTTLHRNWKVVVGDFNDLNVLVDCADDPWIIDADSMQFGRYLCRLYTEKFVDPLLCDRNQGATHPVLAKPHTEFSDWYAWNVMLFRSLLLCDPFGGVYKPQGRAPKVPHTARSLNKISVFHKDVLYPKPAVPIDRLPDGLLDWFQSVFEGPQREAHKALLINFRWTKCTGCGTQHGRSSCPSCQKAAPAAVKEAIQVRGKVTSTRVFRTRGEILFAAWQGNELRYVYATADERGYWNYYRETGKRMLEAETAVKYRWRIQGPKTLMGSYGKMHVWDSLDSDETPTYVDSYGLLPVFDAGPKRRFWAWEGVLYRDADFGPERIGEVLRGQTLFWVGSDFGFGFYRAADLSVALVFGTERGGLNDTVKLPPLRGNLMDSTAFFSKDRVWFLAALKQGPKILTRCTCVDAAGAVLGHLEEEAGTGILGDIRGKCAVGPYLFMVTDEGLSRLEVSNGSIVKSAEFPDAEPFVNAGCHLFPAPNGLYVVDRTEIRMLKMD